MADSSAPARWWSSSVEATWPSPRATPSTCASALLVAVPGACVLPVLLEGATSGGDRGRARPGRGRFGHAGHHGGRVRARWCLILLGADPLSDLPDGELAERGLGAATVIAVDTHLTPSAPGRPSSSPPPGRAKAGTTTNLARVTTLSQKITPPGSARPDWVIATDLATAMGPRWTPPRWTSCTTCWWSPSPRSRQSPARHGRAARRRAPRP